MTTKTPEQEAAEAYACRVVGNLPHIQDFKSSVEDFLAGVAWRDANPRKTTSPDPHGRGKWNQND